jgi:Porin PorA
MPVRAQLIGSLAALPDPIPLSYAARSTLHVFADRTTGLPLDETVHQQVLVGVELAGQRADLMPVLDVSAAFTPDTVRTTADLARSASTKLTVIGIVTPAVLGVLGLLCSFSACCAAARRRALRLRRSALRFSSRAGRRDRLGVS